MSTAPKRAFRLIGTTSDVVNCERCGKPDLRSTVILEWLDAEGNGTGEHVYYGSVCASRALADRGIKATPASIRKSAQIAQDQRREMAAWGLHMLNHYGIPLDGEIDAETFETAAQRFQLANRTVDGLRTLPETRQLLADGIDRWREQVKAVS